MDKIGLQLHCLNASRFRLCLNTVPNLTNAIFDIVIMTIETRFIKWLKRMKTSDEVLVGIGDDAAIVKFQGKYLVLKVDNTVENRHFAKNLSPEAVGIKSVLRALSDIAAMAAIPKYCLVSLVVGKNTTLSKAKRLMNGIKKAASKYNVKIIGGDTSTHNGPIVISITIAGVADKLITRTGTKKGDYIYVTGKLGGSILRKHADFKPQIEAARKLANKYEIHSMIDTSDGLVIDLSRILDKKGAIIYKDKIPISNDAKKFSKDGLTNALYDGEDYELLFTTPQEIKGFYKIGRVVAKKGIHLNGNGHLKKIPIKGWEH